MAKKDNSTFRQKIALRRKALEAVPVPLVLETHGGIGKIGDACYADVQCGLALEKDPEKAAILSRKRPTWAVYEADCEAALGAGLFLRAPFNFIDVDPYGSPWQVLDAILTEDRLLAPTVELVVNDGMRQKVQLGGAWSTRALKAVVARRGNDLHGCYLEVCRELLEEKAALAGYRLSGWVGYYCGHGKGMTHYWATLHRQERGDRSA